MAMRWSWCISLGEDEKAGLLSLPSIVILSEAKDLAGWADS
jgi:hypothetical protein